MYIWFIRFSYVTLITCSYWLSPIIRTTIIEGVVFSLVVDNISMITHEVIHSEASQQNSKYVNYWKGS